MCMNQKCVPISSLKFVACPDVCPPGQVAPLVSHLSTDDVFSNQSITILHSRFYLIISSTFQMCTRAGTCYDPEDPFSDRMLQTPHPQPLLWNELSQILFSPQDQDIFLVVQHYRQLVDKWGDPNIVPWTLENSHELHIQNSINNFRQHWGNTL